MLGEGREMGGKSGIGERYRRMPALMTKVFTT